MKKLIAAMTVVFGLPGAAVSEMSTGGGDLT